MCKKHRKERLRPWRSTGHINRDKSREDKPPEEISKAWATPPTTGEGLSPEAGEDTGRSSKASSHKGSKRSSRRSSHHGDSRRSSHKEEGSKSVSRRSSHRDESKPGSDGEGSRSGSRLSQRPDESKQASEVGGSRRGSQLSNRSHRSQRSHRSHSPRGSEKSRSRSGSKSHGSDKSERSRLSGTSHKSRSKSRSRDGSNDEDNGSKSRSRRGSNDSQRSGQLTVATSALRRRRQSKAPIRDVERLDNNLVQIHMQGRPVVFRIPPDQRDSWDPEQEMSDDALEALSNNEFRMEWIYGYRGRNSRGANIHYLPTGELAYYIAAVVVLYNPVAVTQRHYKKHENDITALAVHPDKSLCASAQAKGVEDERSENNPSNFRVWNYDSLETYFVSEDLEEIPACLAFSCVNDEEMSYLALIEDDKTPRIHVWSVTADDEFEKFTSEVAASDDPQTLAFFPGDMTQFVSAGDGYVNLWTIDEGDRDLKRKQGLFTRKIPRPKSVLCTSFAKSGEILSGDTDGNVMIWRSTKVVRVLKGAHQGEVGDVCVMEDGSFVSGGLEDGAFVVFDDKYQLIGAGALLPESLGSIRRMLVRSYSSDDDGNRSFHLTVGTTSNCIVEVSFRLEDASTEILDFEVETLMEGHAKEILDVASIPNQDRFISCSKDETIVVWDALAHKAMWKVNLGGQVNTLDVSHEGNFLLAGLEGGHVFLVDIESGEGNQVIRFDDPISKIALSPSHDGAAVATDNGLVHVLNIDLESTDGMTAEHLFTLEGHSSRVKHIDWSEDGRYLRTNSADYELLFWDVKFRGQVTDGEAIDDIGAWATHTCPLTFESLAIWTYQDDGTDINSVDRAKDILAVGDDSGYVSIYPYPASTPRTSWDVLRGGSSAHVTAVKFLAGGTRLISAGGQDASLIQWSTFGSGTRTASRVSQ